MTLDEKRSPIHQKAAVGYLENGGSWESDGKLFATVAHIYKDGPLPEGLHRARLQKRQIAATEKVTAEVIGHLLADRYQT